MTDDVGAAGTAPAPVTSLYHPHLGCSQAMLACDGKDTQTTLQTDCPNLQKNTRRRHTDKICGSLACVESTQHSGPKKGFGSHRAVVEITPNE